MAPHQMDNKKRERVAKACASCRRRKIKCNGEPRCSHCASLNLECVYEGNKARRPRAKASEKLASRLHNLETMVAEIAKRLGDPASTNLVRSKSLSRTKTVSTSTQIDSTADDGSSSESSSEASSYTKAMEEPGMKSSLYKDFNTLLDTGDSPINEEGGGKSYESLHIKFMGPQLGFSMLFSQDIIDYIKSYMHPSLHYIVLPLQTLPVYLSSSKRVFNSIWTEPQILTAETICELQKGCFPDENLILELLDIYGDNFFSSFACSSDEVRKLFDKFYNSQKSPGSHRRKLTYSELMIMNLAIVMGISLYVDLSTCHPSRASKYKRLSSLSLHKIVTVQESVFKNVLFYYNRITTVSEGLTSIQALILLAVYLETSWVISEVNFSLICLAVRYAHDMGLHRSESADHLSEEERRRRAEVWTACLAMDMEVCYRQGKPPSIHLFDVSLDNSHTSMNNLCGSEGMNRFGRLAVIRYNSYIKLFSAQVKYESAKEIQAEVNSINNDMFMFADSGSRLTHPVFYSDPDFEYVLRDITEKSSNIYEAEIITGFHLAYFSHLMTVNRVPWMLTQPGNESTEIERLPYKKLSLDSARTILHIFRAFNLHNNSLMSFNWLMIIPFSAMSNILTNCLTNPDDEDVLRDLSLAIDVSLNTFARISAKGKDESLRLFYIRVEMTDVIIRAFMRAVFTFLEQTRGMKIIDSTPHLREHLEMVEAKYPKFYKNLPKSFEADKFLTSLHPGTKILRRNLISGGSMSKDENHSDTSNPYTPMYQEPTSENPSTSNSTFGINELNDFLNFGDKLQTFTFDDEFGDVSHTDYSSMQNLFSNYLFEKL